MIGKHNLGGFRIPEEPPVWPARDLDTDETNNYQFGVELNDSFHRPARSGEQAQR